MYIYKKPKLYLSNLNMSQLSFWNEVISISDAFNDTLEIERELTENEQNELKTKWQCDTLDVEIYE